jgi:hypothetical protein
MASKPTRIAPEDMPTEREAEGIRQLLMMVKQMQDQMQQRDPEGFARLMEMQRKGPQR